MESETPDFVSLDGPSVGPILEVHWRKGRGHDGWVTFHRKSVEKPGKLDSLFAVRGADLRDYFPQFRELLDQDAYFSINGFWRTKPWGRSRHSPDGLDLQYPDRTKKNLRWLTAVFADLDCYKLGISTGQAVGAVLDAQDAGQVPPPSMLVRSGQGVWAFWFLVADNDERALPPAFREKVDLWYLMQRRIGDLFAKFGSDADSRDASRITRIPGSINRKSGTRTEYALMFDADGQRRVYRLHELAERLEVREHRRHKRRRIVDPDLSERGRSGWQAKWLNYYEDFHRLWAMRGGFKVGQRNKAVCMLVTIMRTISKFDPIDEADLAAEVRTLFESLEQTETDPYTEREMITAIKETPAAVSTVDKSPGRKQIANLFEITPAEAAELDSWTLPAVRFRDPDDDDPPTQKEITARRRAALQAEIDRLRKEGFQVPPLKKLAAWLTENGHECAFRTVKDDLAAIGEINPRRHKRRRKSDDPDRNRPLWLEDYPD